MRRPAPKPLDITWFVRGFKVAFVFGALIAIALFACVLREVAHYYQAGKVACSQSINPDYLRVCNVQADGSACTLETITRLEALHSEVELACWKPWEVEYFVVRMGGPSTLVGVTPGPQ